MRLDAATLAALPALRLVAVAATGTDNVDMAACRERGIAVVNIRDYSVVSVPEHVMTLVLALRRNLLAYRADIEGGAWPRSSRFCLFDHPVSDLAGSRLGIIGYGALGRRVAQLGRAFGMRIAVCTRSAIDEPDTEQLPLDELLASADVVSLHLPLTAATRHLIGAQQLARMKPGALLINTARGGLVDEQALAAALLAGRIGAGFDVLAQEPPPADHPLLALRVPHFILTPHMAWASDVAIRTMIRQVRDNIDAFLRDDPRNVVAGYRATR